MGSSSPLFKPASRFGGDDYLLEDRGDAEGVLLRAEDGRAAEDIGRKPYRWLLHDGLQWRLRDGAVIGEVLESREDVIDVRCVGFTGGNSSAVCKSSGG
jgi:hypothetical protein